MLTALRVIRLALPLLVGAGAAAIKIAAGQLGSDLVLVAVAGALLGWVVVVTLEGVLVLVGIVPPVVGATRGQMRQLERDRRGLLRSIKEIELEALVHRLGAAEARELLDPLRQRVDLLTEQIARIRETGQTIDQRIEIELRQREEGR
jgi:hypothetical protein